jgi:hypothetical protein
MANTSSRESGLLEFVIKVYRTGSSPGTSRRELAEATGWR